MSSTFGARYHENQELERKKADAEIQHKNMMRMESMRGKQAFWKTLQSVLCGDRLDNERLTMTSYRCVNMCACVVFCSLNALLSLIIPFSIAFWQALCIGAVSKIWYGWVWFNGSQRSQKCHENLWSSCSWWGLKPRISPTMDLNQAYAHLVHPFVIVSLSFAGSFYMRYLLHLFLLCVTSFPLHWTKFVNCDGCCQIFSIRIITVSITCVHGYECVLSFW